MNNIYYFNNAATTYPKPEEVEASVSEYFVTPPVNSLRHCNCIKKSTDIDIVCKKEISDFFNINTDDYEIILTPGATYSANIAVNAISKKLNFIPTLITNNWCHNCIMRNHYERIGTKPLIVKDLNNISNVITNSNFYVAITHQNNVDGKVISDETIYNVIKECSKYDAPIIIDITQSAGCTPIDISKYNYKNLFVFSSFHKGLYAVPGIGFLTIPKEYSKYKLIYGGTGGIDSIDYTHTNSFEVGTPNELAMKSVVSGIKYIRKNIDKIRLHKQILHNYFIQLYKKLPKSIHDCFGLNESNPESGIISLSNLQPQKCEEITVKLTENYNIIVRSGVHCSPLYHINELKCNSTLRLSFGFYNNKNEIDYLIDSFGKCFSNEPLL